MKGTAVVTGASSGIGLEFARLLAREGYDVALVARASERLERAAKEVGGRVVPCDLRDRSARDGLADLCAGAEILVNNAGLGAVGAFAGTDLDRELDTVEVNVAALTHLTKLALPGMLARRRGGILHVASTAAFQPGPRMAVYYATKAHVLSFSRALRDELRGTGVTVTCLCPGPTRTGFQQTAGVDVPLFQVRYVTTAAEVARAGVDGLLAGRALVIPGLVNRVLSWGARLGPTAVATAVARRLNGS